MKYSKIWLILSLLLSLGFIILLFSHPEHPLMNRMFFSADKIYNSIIFKDVFIDGTGLKGWHLNAAPNFFPDMFIYFIIMSVFRDIHVADFIFVILQYMGFLLLTCNLFHIVAGSKARRYSTLFVLLNLLFLFIPLFTSRYLLSFNYISISYHFGTVIMSMASFNFLFAYLRDRKRNQLVWLMIFTILGTVSDRLYIVHFVIPSLALVVFMLRKDYFKTLWIPLLSVTLFTPLGLLILRAIRISKDIHVVSTGSKMFYFENIGYSWERFWVYMHSLIKNSPDNIILIIGGLAFLIAVVFIVRNLIRFYKKEELESKVLPLFLTVVLTVFIPVVMFTPVINGAFIGSAIIRFNFMAIGMGLILFPLLLLSWNKISQTSDSMLKIFIPLSSLLLAILLIINIARTAFIPGLKEYFHFYPKTSQVLDKLKDEHDLKYGVTGYWEAKKTTAYSQNDLRIYTVLDKGFKIWYHTTNENWYHSGGKGKYKDPVFNFISLGNFKDTEAVQEIFGERMDTIFNDGDMLVVKVPEFTFDRKSRDVIFLEE